MRIHSNKYDINHVHMTRFEMFITITSDWEHFKDGQDLDVGSSKSPTQT